MDISRHFVYAAAVMVLLQPCFARADAPEQSACVQLQREHQSLLVERQRMEYEIKELRDERRRLRETIDRIRSELGNGGVRPTYR